MDSDIETTTEIENEEQISNEEETLNEEKTSSKSITNSNTNSTTKSNSNINIVHKYIKDNAQLIILISGFSGCGKTLFAKSIAKDFDIK